MARKHSIKANGHAFSARTGELILDAALASGIAFPHDCRAGRCGTCLARVESGVALGGHAPQPNAIYACQARALADLELQFDVPPPVTNVEARVLSLSARAPDVVEVGLKLARPMEIRPGQYCAFRFAGFPARYFSPTLPADGSLPQADMTLHVKRVPHGRVSSALGQEITVGHRVAVEGPFGSAWLRPASDRRLVLVAGGTGFAPLFAIASAALEENRSRPVEMIVGAREAASIYMVAGLVGLKRFPNVRITIAIGNLHREIPGIVRRGEPTDFVPALAKDDIAYAAGAPPMVDKVARIAADAGSEFYADPFEQSGADGGAGRLIHRLRRLVGKAGPDAGFGSELADIEGYRMGA